MHAPEVKLQSYLITMFCFILQCGLKIHQVHFLDYFSWEDKSTSMPNVLWMLMGIQFTGLSSRKSWVKSLKCWVRSQVPLTDCGWAVWLSYVSWLNVLCLCSLRLGVVVEEEWRRKITWNWKAIFIRCGYSLVETTFPQILIGRTTAIALYLLSFLQMVVI